ncbi:sec-independent protein translocase protein TatC [Salsuginibacillus halophilus]|uniref:Sec-independent protein translocase protein TatC n=1 Tax=Salsuginibacillus halophilus TaxID=517424 RepID=A0A2P8HWS4_9BACI|nr:twin-arginine translocase subunit TatC [Salsuginibacillus halophilus]PSL50634.1 sec-independent protein translocase protein TatC [Salsuginibacillus halophilus]
MTQRTFDVPEAGRRPALQHLLELRRAMLRSFVILLLLFIGMVITLRLGMDLILGDHELVMLGPMDVIRLYMTVSGVLSLGLALPWFLFEAWRFIKPALHDTEARWMASVVPASLFSFLTGISFGYFIVFPVVYDFLLGLGSLHFSMMITAEDYVSFLLMSTLPLGVLFQLPLVLMGFAAMGLVTAERLSASRKYAYFTLFCLSAFITPPDLLSDLLVLGPFFLLYEFGILLARWVERRRTTAEPLAKS